MAADPEAGKSAVWLQWFEVVTALLGIGIVLYTVDPQLRNDLGLLFLVMFDGQEAVRLEAVPLKLDFCYTRLAKAAEAAWIRRRFRAACAALGTEVAEEEGRLVVIWRS